MTTGMVWTPELIRWASVAGTVGRPLFYPLENGDLRSSEEFLDATPWSPKISSCVALFEHSKTQSSDIKYL